MAPDAISTSYTHGFDMKNLEDVLIQSTIDLDQYVCSDCIEAYYNVSPLDNAFLDP